MFKVSGTAYSVSDKELESSFIKVMIIIDVEVDYRGDDDDELFLWNSDLRTAASHISTSDHR